MFLTIEGHTINTDHIADVTPENHIALSTGSVIAIKSEDEAAGLRVQLIHFQHGMPPMSYAPGRVPMGMGELFARELQREKCAEGGVSTTETGAAEQSVTTGGLFQGMSDSEIIDSLKAKQAETEAAAEHHQLDQDPSSLDIGVDPAASGAENGEEYHP